MKRVMVWGVVLGLLIACVPGLAVPELKVNPSAYIFLSSYDGPMLIMDGNGVPRSAERFDTLGYVNDDETDIAKQLFTAGKGEHVYKSGNRLLVALYSGEGKQLTDYAYRDFSMETGSSWIVFEDADRLAGVMDLEMNVVIEPKYAMLCALRNGGALALKQSPYSADPEGFFEMEEEIQINPVEVTYVAPDGSEKPTGVMATDEPFYVAEGRLCVTRATGNIAVSVLVDETGARISDQEFSWLNQTRNDLGRIIASVSTNIDNTRTGVIDLDGRWLIEPVYYDISLPEAGLIDPNRLRYICGDYGATQDGNDYVARIVGDDGSVVFTGEAGVRAYWHGESISWHRGEESWITDTDGNRLPDMEIDSYGTRVADDRFIQSLGEWPDTEYAIVDGKGQRIAGPFSSLDTLMDASVDPEREVMAYRELVRAHDPRNGVLDDTYHSIENYYGLITSDGQRIGKPVYDTISSWGTDKLFFRAGPNAGIMDIQGNWLYVESDYAMLQD